MTLASVGILIFLAGVFASMNRTHISLTLFILQAKQWSEIPFFSAALHCPESMGINESRQIAATISDLSSKASTRKVHLRGSGFDIIPSDAVEVAIPEGVNVELSWTITARAMGVQSLGIPVNSWDESMCYIVVRERPWMDFQKGRILSLSCLLLSILFVTPWECLRSVHITKQFGVSLLQSIIVIALITRMVHLSIRPDHLFRLTLLWAIPLILIWHVTAWRLECGIVRVKGISFFLGFVFFTIFYQLCIMIQQGVSYHDFKVDPVSFPSIYSNFALLFLIPSAIMLFLYPRMLSTQDLSWDEISSQKKAVWLFIYMFARPIVLMNFLMALNESLLVFFG